MKYGSLILEKKEYVYVKRILNISGYAVDFEAQKSLQKLNDQIKQALIVDEIDMPADVIRFYSSAFICVDQGWTKTLQIVPPSYNDLKNNRISILTPMGAALFGYSEQDEVEWEFPAGNKKLKIEVVTQVDRSKIELTI